MHETILTLASTLTNAAEAEIALLTTLCSAAEAAWAARLREDMAVSDCADAYTCACALSAAAELTAARSAGGSFTAFRAGDISASGGDGAADTGTLRSAAERLMAPYALPDDFAFCGVQA